MKFTDGYWHVRPGLKLNYPMEVRGVRATEDRLTVLASCKKIVTRGDTLNTAILTVHYTSPMPDVIGVELVHHDGKRIKGPEFEKHVIPGSRVQIENGDEIASLTSGNLSVKVHKNEGWSSHFTMERRGLPAAATRARGISKCPIEPRICASSSIWASASTSTGSASDLRRLSKRSSRRFVERRRRHVQRAGIQNVPFYLSNYGYGIFVDHPERVSYEVASEVVSKVQFSVSGERLKYYVIGGASLKEVLDNYTKLTGKPALPPAWSYGLWLTTSFTTSYDEQTVTSFIDGMMERDIPLHVFHFDCFWMKEFHWCDFRWDDEVFPDPEGMLKRLKSKGLHICVWINPYIAQQSSLFAEGKANGYLVKTMEGDVWQWDRWQGGMGLVDFTNPAAVRWFQDKLKALLDMGVDCFKTDFGERIPTDVVYYDESDPVKMHNYYTYLYNKAVFEVLEEVRGKNEAMVFARSATAGGQQFPVHWGGDCSATYSSMAETLRGGLSLGLSGFGFWSHDIGGFENTATPDLYKRWVAFGLLSSHSRLHGNQSYRVPWLFDEESCDVLRFFTRLKATLMPYLFSKSVEATKTGVPVMRAMVLEFTDDPSCDTLDRQYMLGDSLLVAPIFNSEGLAQYYLPEGRWTNWFTGEVTEGGRWIKERHGYFSLPLMVRPGSLIAVGADELRPDYDYADGAALHLFELADGRTAVADVYSTQGVLELAVRVERSGNELTVAAQGAGKPWELVLRGISAVKSVEGGASFAGPAGVRILPETGAGKMRIELA
ncbi:alpha-xylosidase [Paenibacillus cisolokensis]|uniref:Alpha-xylosidase n=1 Tax=Paenibacillus cisolokensis TaxID=1658519 RepID=A0ABQ4N605_9BACL|nr:alpha-xylosidase [Paenibacillus cisolokensis]GIQ63575.1 alpha-xylosidase [Paenibacillus cisolokensis]